MVTRDKDTTKLFPSEFQRSSSAITLIDFQSAGPFLSTTSGSIGSDFVTFVRYKPKISHRHR